jgi:hypothetical protein
MYFKVKITKGLPQAKTGGFTGNNLNKQVISFGGADMNAASRHLENTRYLKEVPRDEANLEAEKGESAFGDINGDGFTEHMLIGGKRHSKGGTALNLPDGTFIFSDTAAMKISDPEILTKFGKKSGSYTPAELAKPYDINKYRTILEDPNSDKVDKKTAELMIKNINLKLGALALAQESKKGFPQGIPEVAQPYMQQMGIKEEDLIPQKAKPQAQINNQAMNNPYENQGMGEQSPEEEMMEQGPGMQNPQEEAMEMPPMAQYGMMTGDYNSPRNFSGDQLYRNGGSLTRYQSKGEVKYDIPEGAVVINRGDYKTEEEYSTARNEQFAKAGKKPVYIVMPDGKYKKLTQKTKAVDPYTGEDLKSTWNDSQEIASQFRDMNKSINTPEFTKVLGNYTRAAIKDVSKYKGKSGKTSKTYEDFSKKDFKDEEIRDAFAKHQKRNMALQAYGIKARYFEDAPTGKLLTPEQMVAKKVLNDNGEPIKLTEAKQMYDKYKSSDITDLNKAFNKVGIPLDNTALEQATFQGFTDALTNKEKLTKEEQAALANWKGYETGVADEIKQANARISPIDRAYTNTTGEQLSSYNKPAESEFVETDVEGRPVEQPAAGQEEIPEAPYQRNPEWWLQDKVNMGLAATDYFDVQKALPWAARYEPELMTPTFYDPTRELAQQSEQANIANQALAQFTGPQALSARSASIQGQGAKQAADTLSRYNNQNVGVANQFEGNNAQIMNEAQRFNQAQNKQLYDQNVIANQQFKNTKRALRHNLGQAYNTGVTNMMQTDAMNQMYPQYAVDPRSGGRMHFTKGKEGIPPTYNEDLLTYANKVNASGLPERVQAKMIDNYMQQQGSSGSTGMPDMYGGVGKKSKKGGAVQMAYVMGSNVFPFQFT